jgi:hypothetical protein
MLEKLIDKSKSEDMLFLSGIIMNILNEGTKLQKEQTVLPELFSTLGIDTTINLIKYFGGETITIPSREEMYNSFLIIVCYYKKKIENKSWSEIKEEVGLDMAPHNIGKIIENIDARIKIEMNELKDMGLDKYLSTLKPKVEV